MKKSFRTNRSQVQVSWSSGDSGLCVSLCLRAILQQKEYSPWKRLCGQIREVGWEQTFLMVNYVFKATSESHALSFTNSPLEERTFLTAEKSNRRRKSAQLLHVLPARRQEWKCFLPSSLVGAFTTATFTKGHSVMPVPSLAGKKVAALDGAWRGPNGEG